VVSQELAGCAGRALSVAREYAAHSKSHAIAVDPILVKFTGAEWHCLEDMQQIHSA
jgi:hypothetical protein